MRIKSLIVLFLLTVGIPLASASAPTSPWTTGQIEEYAFYSSGAGTEDVSAACSGNPTLPSNFFTVNTNEYAIGFSYSSGAVVSVRGATTGIYFTITGTTSRTISAIAPGSDASIIWFDGNSPVFETIVYFKALSSEQLTLSCTTGGTIKTYNSGIAGGDNDWFNECKSSYGCITMRHATSTAIEMAQMFDLTLAQISENTATATIGNGNADGVGGFTWTRLNPGRAIAFNAGTAASSVQIPYAQSFTPYDAYGDYVESVQLSVSGNGVTGCTETMSVIIQDSLQHPHVVADEILNWTFTVVQGSTSTAQGLLTLNYVTGVASTTAASSVISNNVWTSAGNAVTLGTLPPVLETGTTYYLRTHHSADCLKTRVTTTSSASFTGAAYTLVGTTWTIQTGDFDDLDIRVYGANPTTFTMNMTPAYHGGAYYTYIYEEQRDSDLLEYELTGWEGPAVFGPDFYEAGGSGAGCTLDTFKLCAITEYRVGYVTLPFNSTSVRTVTLDVSNSGRNLFYSGTPNSILSQDSKSQGAPYAYVATAQLDSQSGAVTSSVGEASPNMRALAYFSDDGFFFNVNATVVLCNATNAAGGCTDLSTTRLANVGYIVQIRDGRQIVGVSDANGFFSFTGQDLAGKEVTISLSKTGYGPIDFTLNVPSVGGYYTSAMWMAVSDINANLTTTTNGSGGITCSPNPQTKIVPLKADFLTINSRTDAAFYTFFRFSPTTGYPQIISSTYPIPVGSSHIEYPIGRPSEASVSRNDTGRYSLVFTTGSAEILQTCNFAINTNQTNFNASTPDLTSLGIMSATLATQVAEAQAAENAVTQLQARDYATIFAEWAWDDPFIIPNMWLMLLACMIIACAALFVRRSGA